MLCSCYVDTWKKISLMARLVRFITFEIESWKKNRFDLYWNSKSLFLIHSVMCFVDSHLISLLVYCHFEQSHVFLLNCDVCCSFPLQDILGTLHKSCFIIFLFLLWCNSETKSLADAHRRYGGVGTMLVIKVWCPWSVLFTLLRGLLTNDEDQGFMNFVFLLSGFCRSGEPIWRVDSWSWYQRTPTLYRETRNFRNSLC